MIARTHRPQLARSAMEQSIVHRKGQARLAATARCHGGARTQRIIEVGRVHLRALQLCAHTQSGSRGVVSTCPQVAQRPVARTILQAHAVVHVIQCADLRCVWA